MDDNITISSSNGIGGGEGSNTQPTANSREIFLKVFPAYNAMGMSYDEFYNQDHELVIAYREAFKIKQKQINEQLWLQGLYVYHAFCDVAPLLIPFNKHPKAEPYLKEPIPLYDEDVKKDTSSPVENKGLAYMKAKMTEINKKFGFKE